MLQWFSRISKRGVPKYLPKKYRFQSFAWFPRYSCEFLIRFMSDLGLNRHMPAWNLLGTRLPVSTVKLTRFLCCTVLECWLFTREMSLLDTAHAWCILSYITFFWTLNILGKYVTLFRRLQSDVRTVNRGFPAAPVYSNRREAQPPNPDSNNQWRRSMFSIWSSELHGPTHEIAFTDNACFWETDC